jgi:hypothetical protein
MTIARAYRIAGVSLIFISALALMQGQEKKITRPTYRPQLRKQSLDRAMTRPFEAFSKKWADLL